MSSTYAMQQVATEGVSVAATSVGVASAALQTVQFLILSGALIFLAVIGSSINAIYVEKHDVLFEKATYFMSNDVDDFWQDTLKDMADLVRRLYNALICPWNAQIYWSYGVVRDVFIPILRKCPIKPFFAAVADFIVAVMKDVVLFIASGRFLSQFTTFTHVTPAGITLFQTFINVYKCFCLDLGEVVEALPVLEPLLIIPASWFITVPLIFFSAQWTDPQMWCSLENAFNALVALVQQFWRLVTQLIRLIFLGGLGDRPFERPDFRDFVSKTCPAVVCFMRATENAYQRLWDLFVPFKFIWHEYLCIIDTGICIILKTAAFAVRLLVNIDQAVTYPENPFWESVMKDDMTEIINLWVAPTNWDTIRVPSAPLPLRYQMRSYYWDLTSDITPSNKPNPIKGMKRLSECICIFITRTICDPSSTDTACFSQGAQNLLMGLDFCCLTNTVLVTLADFVTGLIEFSYHLAKGPDDFFLFVDKQPFTTVLRLDLVVFARCVLSVFGLIPVVGTCIRELLVGIIAYLLGLIDFAIRVLVGLLTLPYFIIALPSIPNFLQAANLALNFFVDINEALITDESASVKNCLCVILNNGFPVPPIPCSSCQVQGFTPPPAVKRLPRTFFGRDGSVLSSPVQLMREMWGLEGESEYPITPLLRYENHTSNPVTLFNKMMINVQMLDKHNTAIPRLDDINKLMDGKQKEIMTRWHRIKQCNQRHEEGLQLQATNPRLYEYNRRQGLYSCDPNEPFFPPPPNVTREKEHLRHLHHEREMSALREYDEKNADPRLTLGPLDPPVIGCSNPTPPCFNLCCVFKTSLVLIVHTLQSLARFLNGIIQGSASVQGTVQDFPYFTGEFADFGQNTFESDIVQFILDLFSPVKCLCQVLNLIIPVTPTAFTAGRPDICCAIQRIAELIACIIQVIYNTINSIALGNKDNFIYFRGGFFYKDVSMIFDIMLAVVDCLCIFVHAIFPLDYIPGFAAASDFDICCAAQAILVTLIEIARGALQAIIALATITIDNKAYCFWRLDRTVEHPDCAGTLDGIGVVKQIDVIIDSFLPKHGQDGGLCKATCKNDNGASGIVPCICQLFNTLIPWRDDPSKKVNCSPDPLLRNCPRTDFCCPFSKLGFFIADSLKFVVRGLVALWQPWNGLPEFFINYVFCDEGQVAECPDRQTIPPTRCALQKYKKIPACPGIFPVIDENSMNQTRCGDFTCGQLNIVIRDLTHPYEGLIARCTCQFIGLLDQLIALLFKLLRVILPQSGWACCFCGGLTPDGDCNINLYDSCSVEANIQGSNFALGSSGVLTGISYTINQILVAVFGFVRKFPLSCYWKPCVPSLVEPVRCPNNVPQKLDETWIFSFLAGTANALAVTVGNLQCFAQSAFLLPRVCLGRGEKWLGSVVRWVFEIVMRVIGFIETFVTVFIAPDNTCVGPTCDQKPGTKVQTSKGVTAKDLGKMMVILLSIPNDITIGDSDVACTTICPSAFAVPAPTTCGCWNAAPLFGAGQSVYSYTNNNSLCINPTTGLHIGAPWGLNRTDSLISVVVNNGGSGYKVGNVLDVTGGSVGRVYVASIDTGGIVKTVAPAAPGFGYSPAINVAATGGTGTGCTVDILNVQTGCCLHVNPTKPNPKTPICVNPDEAVVQPGPCADLGACRPDALPSIANDPNMPPALARNFYGAADGILMGLTKYMKCILNNIFCNPDGTGCARIGTVLYPAVVIQSIVWQILGGFIRFIVSCILFFFSLFTPPDGNGCQCWNTGTFNGWGKTVTHYHARVSGLCYRCRLVGWDCSQNYMNARGDVKYEAVPCPHYCPYNQQLRNPGIDAATAMNLCIAEFANATLIANASWVNAATACNPPLAPLTIPNVCVPWEPAGCGNVTFTTNQYGFDFYPFSSIAFTNGDSTFFDNRNRFLVPDLCIRPQCQYGGPAGDSNTGWIVKDYPGWASNEYPSNPLVTCGVIQVIQNFLDVFTAFVDIFTRPLLPTPDTQVRRRDGKFTGPARREAFQEFRHRVQAGWRNKEHKRYDGTIYFQDYGDYPNFAVAMTEALYNYDTSDCYNDPIACFCRNLPMESHCIYDTATQQVRFQGRGQRVHFDHQLQRDVVTNMTDVDLMNVLATEYFTDSNVCDHVVQGCANMTWDMVKDAERHQMIKCGDKAFQGYRMNALSSAVPTDIMYNSHAPLTLMRNLFHQANKRSEERAAQTPYQIPDIRTVYKRSTDYIGTGNYMDHDPNHPPHVEFEENPTSDNFDNGPVYWDGLHEALLERSHATRAYLKSEYGYRDDSIMMDAIVQADQVQYKYDLGFYGRLIRKAVKNIQVGGPTRLPTRNEGWQMVKDSLKDLWTTVNVQQYSELWNATHAATRMVHGYVADVVDEGVNNHMWGLWDRYVKHRESMTRPIMELRQKQFKDMIDHMPLVKWWNYMLYSNTTTAEEPQTFTARRVGIRAFWNHLSKLVTYQRENWQRESVNFFNADLKLWSVKDILFARWGKPEWTEQKLANLERLKNFYKRIVNRVYPDTYPQERALYFSNCDLLEGMANISLKVTDTCVTLANMNMRHLMGSERTLLDQLARDARYRNAIASDTKHHQYVEEARFPNDPNALIRLRDRYFSRNYTAPKKEQTIKDIYHRLYRVQRAEQGTGPARWSFNTWIISVVEDITHWAVGPRMDGWYQDVLNWINNPKKADSDWEGFSSVGGRWWLGHFTRCTWSTGIDGSRGLGFEEGIKWTLLVFGVVVVGTFFFTPISIPFQILGWIPLFFVLFFELAYMFSPACLIPSPSLSLVGIMAPFPLADDLFNFANKWITSCYSPLLWPDYMISGELCPPKGQQIDFINCKIVGVADGIQNILYIGNLVIGSWFDMAMTSIAGTPLLETFIPGIGNYMRLTMASFRTATDTQKARQWWCFWATLPSLLLPGLIIYLAGSIAFMFVPAIWLWLASLWRLFMVSPLSSEVPGSTSYQDWYVKDFNEPKPTDNEEEQPPPPPPRVMATATQPRIMSRIQTWMWGAEKQKKE